MSQTKEIVPQENAYLGLRILMSVIFALIVLIIAYCGVVTFSLSSTVLGIAILFAVSVVTIKYIAIKASLSKERYSLGKSMFLSHGGGLFSDYENELNIKNITQVKLILPFWEYMFFKTGHVRIESAGASSTEILLRSIKEPQETYDYVLNRMKANGFKLSLSNRVKQTRPHSLAVFFEVFQAAFGVVFFIAYLMLAFTSDSDVNLVELFSKYKLFLVPVFLCLFLAFFAYLALYYCDLIKRIYTVYDDAFEYKEGFLNKAWAVIPIENISDSSVTQGIVSRMFGLYDIKLSCQGASQEIMFKNIVDGNRLSTVIDELITSFKEKSISVSETDNVELKNSNNTNKIVKRISLDCDRDYTYQFSVSVQKIWKEILIFSPLYLIIFPLAIFRIIYASMVNSINTFKVKKNSIEHSYKFLHKYTKEFSFEKITGIIIRESILDRWCNTASLLFWSVGSADNFIIPGVHFDDEIQRGLLSKKGIKKQAELYSLRSNMTIASLIQANLMAFIVAVLLTVAAAITFPLLPTIGQFIIFMIYLVIALISCYMFSFYQNMSMTFYEDYIVYKRGVILKESYYILYPDIKDIETLKYFMSDKGKICFNVAGEIIVKTKNGEYAKNCSFVISHLSKTDVLDEVIDLIFHKRPRQKDINALVANPRDTGEESLIKVKPSKANSLLVTLCLLVPINFVALGVGYALAIPAILGLLLTFLVVDIIIVWLVCLNVDAVTYCMQSYRILKRSGIFYKRQKSIIYDKIDFINNKQGMLNKIFSNGNVSINTVGSSNVELELKNIKEFKKFYKLLKEKYSSQ